MDLKSTAIVTVETFAEVAGAWQNVQEAKLSLQRAQQAYDARSRDINLAYESAVASAMETLNSDSPELRVSLRNPGGPSVTVDTVNRTIDISAKIKLLVRQGGFVGTGTWAQPERTWSRGENQILKGQLNMLLTSAFEEAGLPGMTISLLLVPLTCYPERHHISVEDEK